MKNRSFFSLSKCVSLLAASLLTGCITINFPGGNPANPTQPPQVVAPTATSISATPIIELPTPASSALPGGLTDEVIRNGEYLSPLLQVPIQLVDGEYSQTTDENRLHAALIPEIQYGDLNQDGIADAAFTLSEDTGGSGNFVSLIVVFSQDGSYQQAPGVMIDDRPVIDSVTVENGKVQVSGLVHAPNDPMVNPTTRMQAEYTLFGGEMVLTRYTSAFGGGAEHLIFIDSPVEGEEVTNTLQLHGSMPMGPFENNLRLQILDPIDGVLVEEGFMVQAEEMAAPATFNNAISLPGVAAGRQVLVVLSELSMADGKPIAVDSVLVTVR